MEDYDDRLQFMTRSDALLLDESVRMNDVSRAWLVWSGAAEAALADEFGLVGIRFTRLAAMLLMPMMLLMSSCIGILPSLPCLI